MKTSLLILTLLAVGIVNAQQETLHSFNVGITGFRIKDPAIQSGAINGDGMSASYFLLKQKEKRKTTLAIEWRQGSAAIDEGTVRLKGLGIRLSDGFQFIKSRNGRFKGYVGYSIATDPSYIQVKTKNDNYYSWNSTSTISLYQSYTYTWKKNSLALDIHLPLAGLASRPAGAIYPATMNGALYSSYSDLTFISPANYKAFYVSLEYRREISKKLQFFAGAYYNYQDQQFKIPFRQQGFSLRAGLIIKL